MSKSRLISRRTREYLLDKGIGNSSVVTNAPCTRKVCYRVAGSCVATVDDQ